MRAITINQQPEIVAPPAEDEPVEADESEAEPEAEPEVEAKAPEPDELADVRLS